jgi:hypothetical protein
MTSTAALVTVAGNMKLTMQHIAQDILFSPIRFKNCILLGTPVIPALPGTPAVNQA